MERLTVVTVPSFGLAAPLLRTTELIATLPYRLARRLATAGEVALLDMPYQPITSDTEIAWHERADADAGIAWLIDRIASACAKIDPLPEF